MADLRQGATGGRHSLTRQENRASGPPRICRPWRAPPSRPRCGMMRRQRQPAIQMGRHAARPHARHGRQCCAERQGRRRFGARHGVYSTIPVRLGHPRIILVFLLNRPWTDRSRSLVTHGMTPAASMWMLASPEKSSQQGGTHVIQSRLGRRLALRPAAMILSLPTPALAAAPMTTHGKSTPVRPAIPAPTRRATRSARHGSCVSRSTTTRSKTAAIASPKEGDRRACAGRRRGWVLDQVIAGRSSSKRLQTDGDRRWPARATDPSSRAITAEAP